MLGLGHALRLWRDAFPIADGGTAILVHGFNRHFTHPDAAALPGVLRGHAHRPRAGGARGRGGGGGGATSARSQAYRAGRTCHPLLPFADWAACAPALARLGAVLVAGCRDSVAARQLGFVPTHGLGAALAMAHGRADGEPRVGFLLSPPYFPLRVGSTT